MMSYSVNRVETSYQIVEKDTNLTIYELKDEREARKICRSLNLGAGFDGFTPTFFTFQYIKPTKKAPT
jgi:hypothetical protein